MRKILVSLKSKKIECVQSDLQDKHDIQTINLKKLVTPVDFEDIYLHNQRSASNDPHSILIKIAEDDVKINTISRKQTVINNGIPPNIEDIFPNNLLAKLCIVCYQSDWVVTCYKDLSYNCAFWSLPNVYSQLCAVKEQKFIIDEGDDKCNENLSIYKTKGIYFESQLAICGLDEYDTYLKCREENQSAKAPVNVKNYGAPQSVSHVLSELNDGMKILKQSIPRDGNIQEVLYLDTVDLIQEVDEYWITLSFKNEEKIIFLYAGNKENRNLWLTNLRSAIKPEESTSDKPVSYNSLKEAEEPAQAMLSKILLETEQSATELRKKDHQPILAICPDIRECITKKSNLTSSNDGTLTEKLVLTDRAIRLHVEQTKPRRYFRLSAKTFLTSVQIKLDGATNKDEKILPEPFFISCCLIHIDEGRRISEVFQWNPNHPSIENMLPQELFSNRWYQTTPLPENNDHLSNKTPLDLPTFPNRVLQNCKSFLVKTPYPNDQIGILIRIDKVFNGAMSSSVEKYSKYGAMSIVKRDAENEVFILESSDYKTGQLIHKSMTTFCSNIGNYRMPFCWSFCRLGSNGSKKLRLIKYDNTKTSDEDLFKQVQGLNMESMNKGIIIPGYIELSVEEVAEKMINDMADLVTDDLICKINSKPSDGLECCKEIKEFITDPLVSKHAHTQIKKGYSTENSMSPGNSKPNSTYGSSSTLLYSDDNMDGDITPPYDAQPKSLINGEHKQYPSSKSLDIIDSSTLTGEGGINQDDLLVPFLDFMNTLYLYPRSLNFTGQSVFQRARNLSCFVELRDSDRLDSSVPLKVIFSRPSNKQPAFDSWANTSVTYHDSSPTFNEEIKIALPLKLHAKHHFLFRFYHVSCDTAGVINSKDKGSSKKHVESPVGFAWMPVLDKNLNLNSGVFNLPVSTNLPTNYLDNHVVLTKQDDTLRRSTHLTLPRIKVATDNTDNDSKRHSYSKFLSYTRHKEVTEQNSSSLVEESTDYESGNIQWVDGQKSLFNVAVKPASTIYTQNLHLHKFFRVCSEKLHLLTGGINKRDSVDITPKPITDSKEQLFNSLPNSVAPSFLMQNDEIDIKNAIKALGTVNVTDLIQFIGPTFNQLFAIIVGTCTTSPDISKTALTSVITLTSIMRGQSMETLSPMSIKRNTKILNNYIKYSFDAAQIVANYSWKSVHECLSQTVADLITPPFRDTNFVHSFLHNSFLIYSVIVKSMIQCSMAHSKDSVDRQEPMMFTATFMTYMENMMHLVLSCILEVASNSASQANTTSPLRNQNISMPTLSSSANKDLARFIARLFNVMDRGFIFRQIYQYIKIINSRIDSPGSDYDHLTKMKFEFLEIICQHEHFIPLNLINIINKNDKAYNPPEMLLSESFCKQHYLVGLILQQVHQYMSNVSASSSIRRIPFVLLRNLLAKHLFDDRYNNDRHQQSRIAALYLPLMAIILQNQKALSMPGSSYTEKSSIPNPDDHMNRSELSKLAVSFAGDTISTHSSIDGSGSEGAGGSIYGVGSGACNTKSTRSSLAYLGKDGRVESHFLNMIAGLNPEGTFRDLSSRRNRDSDNSSVHSTSTLTGLDSMDVSVESSSLSEEMVIHTKIDLNDSASRRGSLQRPIHSNNTSIGKRSATGSNISNQRISSGLGVNTANIPANKNSGIKSPLCLNEKTQKDVFICLMHVLSTISAEDLRSTMCNLTVQERYEVLQLLIYAIHHLKYQGKSVINKFESISKGRFTPGHGQVQIRHKGQRNKISDGLNDSDEGKALLEGNLSTEVGLIVLDVLSAYCSAYKQEILTYNPDHVILQRIIDVYINLLNVNQSDTVLKHILVSMRIFVCSFSKVIFSSCHSVICDLSLHVLRFCDSISTSVRVEACGFLYRMMRCSFEAFNKAGFNRVHLQMIVAVSKLDRIVGRRFNESLNYLRQLAELEIQKELLKPPIKPKPSLRSKSRTYDPNVKMNMQQFFEEVSDLTQRIRTVLMATVRMNEHRDDPEMLVDLQYSLAKSYSSNPALRRTWLEKISAVHEKTNSKVEIAMCKAHIVAMIAEYLQREDLETELFSIGCADFKEVSPNIPNEESGMRDDSIQLEVHYSKEEVIRLLKEVAQQFDSAGLWEVLRHVYKPLIPIYENKRDYEELEQIYQHLAAGYKKIKDSEATNQRLIGSYYRVIFYGKPFENLAGKVFIYRLDSGKQFCVAREELQKLFENKYGQDKVQMLVDNYIDQKSLDPELASIQVTHVDPYFDEEEERHRHSMFECQYNICKFSLETPFIKKSPDCTDDIVKSTQTDDLNIQWKRRTILTVEASFPHLKRRLEVISTKEIDFSPIERAIDEIKSKNRQLIVHVTFAKLCGVDNKSISNNSSHSGNINLLMDIHLTGALLPQVNQGPMAYARVFLQKETQDNFPNDKVHELKVQFMEFLSLCNLLLCDYYELMTHVHDPKYRAMRSALDKYRIDLSNLLKEEITVDHERRIISSGQLADLIRHNLVKRLGHDVSTA